MGLTETQEAEVRKAFAMCDRDGNGSIDVQELGTVVRAVLNHDPDPERMMALFKMIDTDNRYEQ
jgi:Ca2+-binding EF-hand superfamily protein